MKEYQKNVADLVTLTDAGISQIKDYENNYSDETRPISPKERDWGMWNR